VEGATGDSEIQALRKRQVKNFAAILLLARGVPMFLAGDEFGRTQGGNNNAYCQDNEISWLDWGLLEGHRGLFEFFKGMIALRKRCAQLRQSNFFEGRVNPRGVPEVGWHGCELNAPGWQDPVSQVLAFTLGAFNPKEADLHVMMNMGETSLPFQIPALQGRHWYRYADTSLPGESAMDIGASTKIEAGDYLVTGRSIVILLSR
jgi:glycogen operon protein